MTCAVGSFRSFSLADILLRVAKLLRDIIWVRSEREAITVEE